MTAGSFCYIGSQGIVHGTTITVMQAGRKYLGRNDLRGTVFVTAGLGGMSGAQAKAAVICGAVAVVSPCAHSLLLCWGCLRAAPLRAGAGGSVAWLASAFLFLICQHRV